MGLGFSTVDFGGSMSKTTARTVCFFYPKLCFFIKVRFTREESDNICQICILSMGKVPFRSSETASEGPVGSFFGLSGASRRPLGISWGRLGVKNCQKYIFASVYWLKCHPAYRIVTFPRVKVHPAYRIVTFPMVKVHPAYRIVTSLVVKMPNALPSASQPTSQQPASQPANQPSGL
jgi:hypothetical protein